MGKNLPDDEFARVTSPGGRYRLRTGAGRKWLSFLRLTVLTAVLAALAIFGLKNYATNLDFVPEPAIVAPVNILDGSQRDLATKVASKLVDAGYEVVSAKRLVNAADPNAAEPNTKVYARSKGYLAKANELATLLKAPAAELKSDIEQPITVVLGADYK